MWGFFAVSSKHLSSAFACDLVDDVLAALQASLDLQGANWCGFRGDDCNQNGLIESKQGSEPQYNIGAAMNATELHNPIVIQQMLDTLVLIRPHHTTAAFTLPLALKQR